MTAHKHAALMLQYAQDAAETDKPWERWESRHEAWDDWGELAGNPVWYDFIEYRRKQKTVNINGFEVPEPCRELLEENEHYFSPAPSVSSGVFSSSWNNSDPLCNRLLQRGLIHLTCEAAEIHAKALMSFTMNEVEK